MSITRKTFIYLPGAALAALCAVFLMTQQPQAADGADKAEIEKIVREYLVNNPEIVIEAIESYQANQEEIEKRQFEKNLSSYKDELYSANLPYAGNPDGDVTIVEFFDYNCGYCKRAMVDITKVLENDDQVKVIFMEMPILSETSNDAARYSLAAHNQGKYFEYHQALMKMSGSKSTKSLEKVAKEVGLDVDQLRKDADSKEVRQQIEESKAISRKLGVRGTPAFIINDIFAPGYMTYQNMQAIIEKARDDAAG